MYICTLVVMAKMAERTGLSEKNQAGFFFSRAGKIRLSVGAAIQVDFQNWRALASSSYGTAVCLRVQKSVDRCENGRYKMGG